MLRIESDPQADAVYIYVGSGPVAYTKELDENRYIDYGYDDAPVGVDLLSVSDGVNLDDLPQADTIGKALEGLGLKIFA